MWWEGSNSKSHNKRMQQLDKKGIQDKHDKVEKVVHKEFGKKLKFDNADQWYMYKSESVFEHDTHKILGDFEIQTSQKTRPSIDWQEKNKNERTCRVDFAVTVDHRVKIDESENTWILPENRKKYVENEVVGAFGMVSEGLKKKKKKKKRMEKGKIRRIETI